MSIADKKITIDEIKTGFNSLFVDGVKKLSVEEDEEQNTFTFELEFVEDVEDLMIPDGIFISFIDFGEKTIDGFVDGVSFLEFVKENT